MTIRFIAVTDGHRADGYLIVQGTIYVARSGRLLRDTAAGKHERGEVPPGTYQMGGPMALSAANKLTMSDGSDDVSRFRKFEIMGVGANRQKDKATGTWGVKDPRYPDKPRTNLRFHFDGDIKGSEGCIVYDDVRAQESLAQAFRAGDTQLVVTYVDSDVQARALVREFAGKDPPAAS